MKKSLNIMFMDDRRSDRYHYFFNCLLSKYKALFTCATYYFFTTRQITSIDCEYVFLSTWINKMLAMITIILHVNPCSFNIVYTYISCSLYSILFYCIYVHSIIIINGWVTIYVLLYGYRVRFLRIYC